MAVGYKISNGQDFDDILEPRSTSKISNVGYQDSNGTDISYRYENDASGSRFGTTGYQNSSGTDVGLLFAQKGSVSFWDGSVSAVPSSVNDFNGQIGNTLAELIFNPEGTIETTASDGRTFRGRWDGSLANSSNTEVYFRIDNNYSPNSNVFNGASSYSSMTSTNAISISTNQTFGQQNYIGVTVFLRRSGDSSTTVSTTISLRVTAGSLDPNL